MFTSLRRNILGTDRFAMRDYREIVRRVESLTQPYIRRRILGEVEGRAIHHVTLSSRPDAPSLLVIGGTHGDEPAGVEAALALLEGDRRGRPDDLNLEVIPCLNPFGYVHNTRHNADRIDINWAFANREVPEIGILRSLIRDRRFEAVIDLHEDWESPGYYLYEMRRDAPLIGQEIARRVADICPLNTNPCIEGAPARAGVIHPDPESETAKRGEGVPIGMYNRHTDHLLTSETPTMEPMETRVKAHLAALEVVVDVHLAGLAQTGR